MPSLKIIGVNFSEWRSSGRNRRTWGYIRKRIYIKGYIWTPFIVVTFHKVIQQAEMQIQIKR